MKILKKIIKNNTVYDTGFDILKQNIDTVVDELNKIEIPNKVSELENDLGYITQTETDDKYALKSDVEELQLFKYPNVTIFGTPRIQNGQVTYFSNTNYLQFPFLVDFKGRYFDIDFSFTTPSDLSGQQNILDSNYGIAFALREGKVVFVASENGTSWTVGEMISDETLLPNTTYYFNIFYGITGAAPSIGFKGGLSKDDMTIQKSVSFFSSLAPKTVVIGRSYVDGGNYFKGSINLNDASLKISGNVVWTGMDDAGLSTRAAVDLSNIDAKGVEVIETIVDNKITTKQDVLVSGTNIKTINGNSILGEGDIHIEGGEGGGTQVIEISSTDYKELTDEQKNDPNKLYVISDAESEYYKKNEVYNKEESDAKYSLKGEGKVYTGGSGITVNNTNNTIGVNAIADVGVTSYSNYVGLSSRQTTASAYVVYAYMRKLKVNGTNETLNTASLLDLDAVYAKTSDVSTKQDTLVSGTNIKSINGSSILGTGDLEIKGNDEWVGSQDEYDALPTKSNSTTYYII